MATEGIDPEEIVKKHAKMVGTEEGETPLAMQKLQTYDADDDEYYPDLSAFTVMGAQITLTNRQMLESWLDHIVYVQLVGHGVVQAKITEVGDTHTKIVVVKDQTKADREKKL